MGKRMNDRGRIRWGGFRVLALSWLPAGFEAPPDGGPGLAAEVRFSPWIGVCGDPHSWAGSLVLVATRGLPPALGCLRLCRLRYRRAAWSAGVGLGADTVAASVVAGLLGPVAIAVQAALFSLPAWMACWWLAYRA